MSKIKTKSIKKKVIECDNCKGYAFMNDTEHATEYHPNFNKTCVVCDKEGCTICMYTIKVRGINYYYHKKCNLTVDIENGLDKRARHTNDAKEEAWNREYNRGVDCS